jgi:DNA-binding beta-propeller fold protein YncE
MNKRQTRTFPAFMMRRPRFSRWVVTIAAATTAIVLPLMARGSELPLRQIQPDVILPGRADRLDYASVDPQHRLLFIAHLGSSSVIAFDLKTGQVVANIRHLPAVHGVLAVPAIGEVFATATGRNRLDVISERDFRVVTHAPAGFYPDGMAYAPDVEKLFISDEHGGTETVVDTRTDRRIATIPMGGHVGNSQYDPVTQRILADVQTLDQIVAIDPRTDRIVARYALPGSCHHDHSLLIDAPSRLAFVTCDGNAKLLLIDMADMRVISVHDVGRDPDVLSFDPGLQRLYVASESGVVSVFKLSGTRLRLLGQKFLAFEAHSVAVDPVTHRVYFPLQNIHGHGVLRVMAPTDIAP